ncbi:MAG: hypothetical protein MUO85_01865 [candidate division Zixibacteria bacterium]|nr:hypothetical protein [candidate division Zixibacteria bacterium]
MAKQDEIEAELNNHETFYAIAIRHYRQIEEQIQKRSQIIKVRSDKDVDCVSKINASIQRDAMVTVVFCALTLEAFINHYGISNSSKSYFDNHLDKLKTVSKWLIIPRLLIGKQINTDGQGYPIVRRDI